MRSIDGEMASPTTSWLETEPVEVPVALRTTGTLANHGRVNPVGDPAAIRALRQRAQAEALAAHESVRAVLLTDGHIRLSQFARLATEAFAELLSLLATGLEAPLSGDGTRRALSSDGRVEVVLRDAGDGRTAVLTTDDGVLTGPDVLISIALNDPIDHAHELDDRADLAEVVGG
jgi:uncharacterized protein (TIGR02677 family)